MKTRDVCALITRLETGEREQGPVEISADDARLLDELVAAGWLAQVQTSSEAQAELEQLRLELLSVRAASKPGDRFASDKERALRHQVLSLSEAVARTDAGCTVAVAPSGAQPVMANPVRGTAYRVTQAGRALLADMGPRLGRAGELPAREFEAHIRALRETFGARAERAAMIATRVAAGGGPNTAHFRAAAVSLASRAEEPTLLAEVFRQAVKAALPYAPPEVPGAAALMAEAAVMLTPQLVPGSEALVVNEVVDHYRWLLSVPGTRVAPSDALDAAIFLAGVPTQARSRVEAANALRAETASQSENAPPVTLSVAILLVGAGDASARVQRAASYGQRLGALRSRAEVAAILTMAGDDVDIVFERWRGLFLSLSRRAEHEPAAFAAALLSLLDGEVSETLDTYRLGAMSIERHRLAHGPLEAMTLATKLLLLSAVRGTGSEGDPEEVVLLRPVPASDLLTLGDASVAGVVPVHAEALLGTRWNAALPEVYDAIEKAEAARVAAAHSHYHRTHSNWSSYG